MTSLRSRMSASSSRPRVAFLGLGLMGTGMARRILDAGFPLTVHNRSAAKAEPFAAVGARVAASPAEAALDAQVIISMVADDEVSRTFWLGENGALAAAAPGTVFIECSTLSVKWIHELAAAAKERGCALIDAPVTGSKPHAAAGELCFVAGGAAEDLEKIRPVLEVMSRAIIHVGPVGSGALLKLVNNFMCGVQAASFAEAVGVIEKAGLDRTKALELLTNGAPGSPLIKLFSQRMADGGYEPNFVLRLMAKDLAYAQNEGAKHGINLATAEAAHGVFQRAIEAGLGEKDFSAVLETFRG